MKNAMFGVMGFFITETWSLRRVLLGVKSHNTSAHQATLNRITADIIEQSNLAEHILAYTADNAGNFSGDGVSAILQHSGRAQRSIESSFSLPCMAHSIQLVEGDFFRGLGIGRSPPKAVILDQIQNHSDDPHESVATAINTVFIFSLLDLEMC